MRFAGSKIAAYQKSRKLSPGGQMLRELLDFLEEELLNLILVRAHGPHCIAAGHAVAQRFNHPARVHYRLCFLAHPGYTSDALFDTRTRAAIRLTSSRARTSSSILNWSAS